MPGWRPGISIFGALRGGAGLPGCGGDFVEDVGSGGGGVGGLGDGSADDEEVCAGGDGRSGCCDTLLVSDGRPCGADAGDDERGPGKRGAGGGKFIGAADEAVDAGVPGDGREAGDLSGGRVRDADGVELV